MGEYKGYRIELATIKSITVNRFCFIVVIDKSKYKAFTTFEKATGFIDQLKA